jgi:NAD(P) transhydrogenase
MSDFDYDLLVIGSGPAGQRAAIQAAKLEKRVAVVERKAVLGGVCINTGTIPSKTLREAVLYLSGFREREMYGASYTVKQSIGMTDLLYRANHVIRNEIEVTRSQLLRNRIEVLNAEASFVDPHTIRLNSIDNRGRREVTADCIVVASGSRATEDSHIPFDGQRVFTSDDILGLDHVPRTLAVIGAGVIGCEYASIFAALGVRVTLIDKRPRLLDFVDSEIIDALTYHMSQHRVTLRLGEEVRGIEPSEDEHGGRILIHLASNKQIIAEKALYSIGRTGNADQLNLPAAGLAADDRGRLKVNQYYQTQASHIYAVGDVIGFPSLAATSMEQGRFAACHHFGVEVKSVPELFPYGIYTIPEISMVGRNEQELTSQGVPYEVGKARYRENARGQIISDSTGLLKLIFHLETRQLLGVHIIGTVASELVHIGQTALAFGATADYFAHAVFNYPTLAECYQTAAFDAINRAGWINYAAGDGSKT